jgi:hypothetical protein
MKMNTKRTTRKILMSNRKTSYLKIRSNKRKKRPKLKLSRKTSKDSITSIENLVRQLSLESWKTRTIEISLPP